MLSSVALSRRRHGFKSRQERYRYPLEILVFL